MRTYAGQCHCGAVKFEIDTVLDKVAHCNCSICLRRNAYMHRVTTDRFRLLEGKEALTLYQFNTGTAKHYFCKTCGIYPFHHPRVAPDEITVNIFCLEGIDRGNLPELEIIEFDGQAFSTVED